MFLGISIVGWWLIAAFYGLAGTLLFWLTRNFRRTNFGKISTVVLALVAVALPVWDEVWIGWHFNELCKSAGVRVTRKVEVDGYYDGTTTGWSKPETVTSGELIASYERDGFRFRERNAGAGDAAGKISHLEKYADGTWRITILDQPTARYHFRHAYQPTPYRTAEAVSWKIQRSGYVVVDSVTGDILGSDIRFIRYPGWVDSLWIRFLGSGSTACEGTSPKDSELRQPLYRYVLVPTEKR